MADAPSRQRSDKAGAARVTAMLARWRVTLGYALAMVAFYLADPTPLSLAAGGALAAAGEALRIWAAGHLEKGREVTTSGPYAFTRHPLYVGSSFLGAGFAVAANSLAVAALVAVYLVTTITAAIRSEEAHLTDKFGDRYPEYREGSAVPQARRFSLARALRNREYRAFAGVLATFALLAAKLVLSAML